MGGFIPPLPRAGERFRSYAGVLLVCTLLIASLFFTGCITEGNSSVTILPNLSGEDARFAGTTESTRNDVGNVTPPSPMPTYIPLKDVNKHFLTIAFSEYNGVVIRQEQAKGMPITIGLFGQYDPADEACIEEFAEDFNRVSRTQKLFSSVKTDSSGMADLWVNIFPERDLHNLIEEQIDYTAYENFSAGTVLYRVDFYHDRFKCGQVFINADLPQEERRHYIIRAVTYWLGMTGDATDPASMFYPGNTRKTDLSESDWRAMTILYGAVVKTNMTVSEVKNRMYTGT